MTASVDWEDVAGVGVNVHNSMPNTFAVHTRPGAPSLQWKRRWILFPLERKSPPGVIVVQVGSHRSVPAIQALIVKLAEADTVLRRDLLGSPAVSSHLLTSHAEY